MHSILRWCAVFGSMAVLAMLGLPGSAAYADETDGHTIVVKSGQSIQAAIDKAAPGSTIRVQGGVYHESLLVQKPLTLKGDGAELLFPATLPSTNPCTEDPSQGSPPSGICVAGEVTKPLHGVTITGFEVEKFPGVGIWGIYTDGLRLLKNRTLGNGAYGIFSLRSTQSLIADNLATDGDEAGIYVGESPNARAQVIHNVVTGNLFGLFLRDSTLITAEENKASGNCVGILALNTGAGAGDYSIRDNKVTANTKSCTSGLPASGLGIVLAGTSNVRVTENRVTDNKPTGPSAFVGGIAVISSALPGQPGGADPVGNKVIENTALRNEPFDLFHDHTGTGNVFRENRCRKSSPDGLCQSGHGDQGN
jgi:parallel beta-helix repeat protein